MATLAPSLSTAAFPDTDVRSCLAIELTTIAKLEASVRQITLPSDLTLLLKTPIRLDSLSVVDAICALEPIVGFELRESIVKTGGYSSIEAAIDHLMPKIQTAWMRKKGKA